MADDPPSKLTHVDEDGQQKESGRPVLSQREYDLGQVSTTRSRRTLSAWLGVIDIATRANSRNVVVDGARAVIASVDLAMLAVTFSRGVNRQMAVFRTKLELYDDQKIWQWRD